MIRLALVEDDELYRSQLREYIDKYSAVSGEKFTVTEFSDGDEIALGYKAVYDIILMDIEMKFMDGMMAAEEIRKILRQLRYGSAEGSTNVVEVAAPTKPKTAHTGIMSKTLSGLPSWRDVMEPHPDVAQGRYKNAEFAADLAQVARGEGAFEYRDPVEFFARTYVTEGMTGLLVQALKRVSGKDGEPVIQLKTAFGGGKTHSMLALYHMMRGKVSADRIPNIKPVLAQAGVSALPKANVAVLVLSLIHI